MKNHLLKVESFILLSIICIAKSFKGILESENFTIEFDTSKVFKLYVQTRGNFEFWMLEMY